MFPMLILSSFAGMPLSEAVVDHLVSKRVVTVERQVILAVVMYVGDPLGSKEAGTLKVLAEPTIMLTHKQTGFFQVGGEGQGGIVIRATPCLRLDGKIGMECDTQISTVNRGRGLTTDNGFIPGVDTEACQTKVVLTPGKPFKVRLSSRSAEDQTWMELTATVVEDSQRAFAAEVAKMTWTVSDTQTVSGIKLIAVPAVPAVRTMTPTFLRVQPAVLPASYVTPSVPMMMPTVVPTTTPAVLPPAIRK
jgi:hypothetical protein